MEDLKSSNGGGIVIFEDYPFEPIGKCSPRRWCCPHTIPSNKIVNITTEPIYFVKVRADEVEYNLLKNESMVGQNLEKISEEMLRIKRMAETDTIKGGSSSAIRQGYPCYYIFYTMKKAATGELIASVWGKRMLSWSGEIEGRQGDIVIEPAPDRDFPPLGRYVVKDGQTIAQVVIAASFGLEEFLDEFILRERDDDDVVLGPSQGGK